MTDYETIFDEGYETSLRGSSGNTGAFTKAHSAALAAVVAAAKADAWDEGVEMMCDGAVRDRDYELNPYRKVTP